MTYVILARGGKDNAPGYAHGAFPIPLTGWPAAVTDPGTPGATAPHRPT